MLDFNLFSGAGYILMVMGLAASFLPILPGPILIWLGTFTWAWGHNFDPIGWPILIVLGILALIGWAADLFLTTVLSRRAGASWKAIGGAILGGIIGSTILSGIVPIIGTIIGAIGGAVLGMWIVEDLEKQDHVAARQAVRGYIKSLAIAAVAELAISLVMLTIFVWQAF